MTGCNVGMRHAAEKHNLPVSIGVKERADDKRAVASTFGNIRKHFDVLLGGQLSYELRILLVKLLYHPLGFSDEGS